jgi:hypothetical protein
MFYHRLYQMLAEDEFSSSGDLFHWLKSEVDENKVKPILLKYCEEKDKENQALADKQLTKKQFCEIINRLQESSDLVDTVNELFRKSRENVENDFCNAAALQIDHEGIVIDLLSKLMGNNEDISYFIYELDYGRSDMAKDCITIQETGEKISLRTVEELWDYLKHNQS